MELQRGMLWEQMIWQTKHALACGALHPLPTESEFIEQGGVRFIVRILANIERKERAKRQQPLGKRGADFNPFLPYEDDLYVADLGETHVCLLNKFNVFEHHLLIVTRHFEEQTELLNEQDFAALAKCMVGIDGLAFYNGGSVAGASQPHKHLQYVALPLAATGFAIPMEPLIVPALTQSAKESSAIPFVHAIEMYPSSIADSADEAAQTLFTTYRRLCAQLHLAENGSRQSASYNLLATRQWMMLVPRLRESYAKISVNALGFAGSFFVRNQEELEVLRDVGPMVVLEWVGKAKARKGDKVTR